MSIRKENDKEMSAKARSGKRLSLAEKVSRLRLRLKTPEWRRYGGTLLAGKLLGVGIVLLVPRRHVTHFVQFRYFLFNFLRVPSFFSNTKNLPITIK